MVQAAPPPQANMGDPVIRVDSEPKVTGATKFAADVALPRLAYGYLLTSAIARGAIKNIDDSEVRAMPGVLAVITHENTKIPGEFIARIKGGTDDTSAKVLENNRVHHDGDIIGLIVAESYEIAREASYRLKIIYDMEEPTASFDSKGVEVLLAAEAAENFKEQKTGDAAKAFAETAAKVDAWYQTPIQHHNPIELFSTTCVWEGEKLTVYEPSRWVTGLKFGLARHLRMDARNIRVLSRFIGGAFGSKGGVTHRSALVAIASKQLNRPVRLVVTRDQGFTTSSYRGETRQRVRMAADKDGKLTSYWHESWEMSSRADNFNTGGAKITTPMYACPNILTKAHIVKGDRNAPGYMRGPPEVPYFFTLETAMDELAEKLKIDPVEFRKLNETRVNPANGAPYTSRSLIQCFDEAAEAFGWSARKPEPKSMRDGEWLIGYGCATSCYPTQHSPAFVRVSLNDDGYVKVQCAGHELGTGAYTVYGQMASECMGLPLKNVTVELGDSDLPPGPVAGGSNSTASICSTIKIACDRLLQRLGGKPDTANLKALFERLGTSVIEEYAGWAPQEAKKGALEAFKQGKTDISGGAAEKRTMFGFGAEFVEVRVNERTREIVVPRMVGAFSAGRIMNTRTAHSQLMSGMIWGVSSALYEVTEIDERTARYVNDNIADYVVPTSADVHDVKVIMVSEVDNDVNPAGVKGLGEMGVIGANAAVANAVYHATGQRIRELPIRIENMFAV
ncbi:MAG: xanthine dehydrogenase family protein molybdopterin-binding subunit [Chitinophagales bacterium]|nr:xanthine dehydrogenase family protein molybdopterin-binding subunit [Hyphomicrobiales bacterium]